MESPRFGPAPQGPRSRPGRLAPAICLLGLVGLFSGCSEPPASEPRDVLLFSIDSLRADHLSSYGYRSATRPDQPTTPHLDRLVADQGVLFERTSSVTSWTLPSHLSLLTGQPIQIHGVRDLPEVLHMSHPLLAQRFQAAGWRTFGLWSGPNLHPLFGFDRGFEEYVDCSTVAVDDPMGIFGVEGEDDWGDVRDIHDASHQGVTGENLVAAFGEQYARLGADERLFAFVHLWDVHYDYSAPAAFDVFHPQPYRGFFDGSDFNSLNEPDRVLTEGDRLRVLSLYDAEILYTDDNLRRMFEVVEAAGRMDDSLIVVTADHGEQFGEHNFFGHKESLIEQEIAIPLMMRWTAGDLAVGRRNALVNLTDVAPTILDLCGLDGSADLWGRSLAPMLREDVDRSASTTVMQLSVRGQQRMEAVRLERAKVFRLPKPEGAVNPYRYVLVRMERNSDETERLDVGPEVPKDDPRVLRAQAVFERLDARADEFDRAELGVLPEALRQALIESGYLTAGSDDSGALPNDDTATEESTDDGSR
ncbi:MAG: sulfatase [Planctomycetota bacterium]|jgi:arylsulfatase A-like enzyme